MIVNDIKTKEELEELFKNKYLLVWIDGELINKGKLDLEFMPSTRKCYLNIVSQQGIPFTHLVINRENDNISNTFQLDKINGLLNEKGYCWNFNGRLHKVRLVDQEEYKRFSK